MGVIELVAVEIDRLGENTMFGERDQDREVQQAQVFSKGDRAINPEDGSEWRIVNANEKTMGEHFVRLESLSGQSEEIGVPDSAFDDWEIERQPLVGYSCACCDWQTDETAQRPEQCDKEQCESGFIRERRKWPDEEQELHNGESEGLNASEQGIRLGW